MTPAREKTIRSFIKSLPRVFYFFLLLNTTRFLNIRANHALLASRSFIVFEKGYFHVHSNFPLLSRSISIVYLIAQFFRLAPGLLILLISTHFCNVSLPLVHTIISFASGFNHRRKHFRVLYIYIYIIVRETSSMILDSTLHRRVPMIH